MTLPDEAWTPHPQAIDGNDACVLISSGGGINDATRGEWLPTRWLDALPSVRRIMRALPCDIERSRLMRIAPGHRMPPHEDDDPYWLHRIRLHVPLMTNDGAEFWCNGEAAKMKAGECWIFDTTKTHSAINNGATARVHLVMDSPGSVELWDA